MSAGVLRVTRNAEGVPAGLYFCKLAIGGQSKTIELMLLKRLPGEFGGCRVGGRGQSFVGRPCPVG